MKCYQIIQNSLLEKQIADIKKEKEKLFKKMKAAMP